MGPVLGTLGGTLRLLHLDDVMWQLEGTQFKLENFKPAFVHGSSKSSAVRCYWKLHNRSMFSFAQSGGRKFMLGFELPVHNACEL